MSQIVSKIAKRSNKLSFIQVLQDSTTIKSLILILAVPRIKTVINSIRLLEVKNMIAAQSRNQLKSLVFPQINSTAL